MLEDLFPKGTIKLAGKSQGSGKLQLSEINKPIRLRFIPGEYKFPDKTTKEILMHVSHWNNNKQRSSWCSSKWKFNLDNKLERDPASQCIGCYLDLDSRERYMRTSVKYIATVLVLEDYHLDPKDWEGTPLGPANDGTPKKRKVICSGEGCEGCARKLEVTWGRKVRWELSTTAIHSITEFKATKKDHCGNCGQAPDQDTGEGGLVIAGLVCPKCGTSFPAKDQSLAYELCRTESKCNSCGKEVKLEEQLMCFNCNEPRRPTIFDMDIWVKQTGEAPRYQLVITDYKIGPIMKKARENIKDCDEPLPLEDIIVAPPLMAQCRLHGVHNPYGSEKDLIENYEE